MTGLYRQGKKSVEGSFGWSKIRDGKNLKNFGLVCVFFESVVNFLESLKLDVVISLWQPDQQ